MTRRVQDSFRAQIAQMPEATRLGLQVAATDSAAGLDVIFQVMTAVGASPQDLEPAERARLLTLSNTGLTFRHPLIRAAAYQDAPHHRRIAIHQAFADAEADSDRRSWHLAAATTAPSEAVAAELERTAMRAQARGGAMAVSAAYNRSARLSTDPARKALRLTKAAHAAYAAGHPDRAQRLAAEAETLTEDQVILADATFLRAQVEYERTSPEADAVLALDAAELVLASDPERAALILSEVMGATRDACAHDLLRQGVSYLRELRLPAGSDLLVVTEAQIAWGDLFDGRPDLAAGPMQELLATAPQRPLSHLHRIIAGFCGLMLADDDATVAVMAHTVADARANGELTWIPYALEILALGHLLRGEPTDAEAVVETTGSLDISVNVISQDAIFQPLLDISVKDFAQGIDKLVTSQLITTKAAARHMVRQHSGVILFFGGADYITRKELQGLGTVQVGMDTQEALRRQWASELGPEGVRVVTLLTGGITETFPDIPEVEPHKQSIVDATLLGRAATLTEVGQVAAFVASDRARSITATQVNISAGACGD